MELRCRKRAAFLPRPLLYLAPTHKHGHAVGFTFAWLDFSVVCYWRRK